MRKTSLILAMIVGYVMISCNPIVDLPSAVTKSIDDVTENTAKVIVQVSDDGGSEVIERGVCWNTEGNPTIIDFRTFDGQGVGTFTSTLEDLKPNTTYYAKAYATNEKGTGYGDELTFTTIKVNYYPDGEIAGHEFVDLGLPSGLKWATCNVGATSAEDYGDYFAWGETSPKAIYTDNTYQHWNDADGDGSWDYGESAINSDISGNAQYDAATANWGGSWRMPTKDEIQELVDYCEWEWTQVNGVNGSKVIGPNGSCIFLPAAGYRYGTSLINDGINGYYWSSTPYDYYDYDAYYLYFYYGYECVYYYIRYYGLTVRPITE